MTPFRYRCWRKDLSRMLEPEELGEFQFTLNYGLSLATGQGLEEDQFLLLMSTGQNDRNGREMFEGDVVEHESDKRTLYEIAWNDMRTGFSLYPTWRDRNGERYWGSLTPGCDPADVDWENVGDGGDEAFEVIGNIFESPDLLRKSV